MSGPVGDIPSGVPLITETSLDPMGIGTSQSESPLLIGCACGAISQSGSRRATSPLPPFLQAAEKRTGL